ncbi:hypothetical protein GBA52_028493 [Prunus armeniaca]|nr:hypothetical protein GBA52_028493 [Prunus armeniaca]
MGTRMQFEIYVESAFTDEFDSPKGNKAPVEIKFQKGKIVLEEKSSYENEIARVLFLLLLFLDAQDQKH